MPQKLKQIKRDFYEQLLSQQIGQFGEMHNLSWLNQKET
jgi:hypothetical protein